MKVAVIGPRDFLHLDLVDLLVSGLPPGTVVISGGARGVDSRAEAAAKKYGFETLIFKPDPEDIKLNGRTWALLERNKVVVSQADHVVAFWNGFSRGTAHAIAYARRIGIPVTVITP